MNERGDGCEIGSVSPPPAKKPNLEAAPSPVAAPLPGCKKLGPPEPSTLSAPLRIAPTTAGVSNGCSSTASTAVSPRLQSPVKCLTSPSNGTGGRPRPTGHTNGIASRPAQQQQLHSGESSSPEDRPHHSTINSTNSATTTVRGKAFHKEKFAPKEELVAQIMDMGICRNGAVKALYWTGNHSALAASNWIFDQPDRDLDTPLEEELEMIRAQQAEREREEHEERQLLRMCSVAAAQQQQQHHLHHLHHHHHHLHHHHTNHEEEDEDSFDEEEEDEEDELDEHEINEEDEEEEEDDEEEEEDIEDDEEDLEEEEMDFKMVFVVNKALELRPGSLALYTSRATVGLYRKINGQPQAVPVGPDELAMWCEYGERMVVLWADSDQHIKDLELMARSLRLPCQMVEVKDDGRKAVLGLFGEEREVNKVTGRLKVVS